MGGNLIPLLLAMGVASTISACGSKADETAPTPVQVPSATPSSAGDTTSERAALTAYKGMWSAFVDASKTSDAEATQLRTYTSGNALKLIVRSLYTNKELGKVAKGDVALRPQVIKLEPASAPSRATVEDCVDSTRWLEYKASGGLWDDKPGGKHRTTAEVKKQQDGTWKVDAFVLERSGTC